MPNTTKKKYSSDLLNILNERGFIHQTTNDHSIDDYFNSNEKAKDDRSTSHFPPHMWRRANGKIWHHPIGRRQHHQWPAFQKDQNNR